MDIESRTPKSRPRRIRNIKLGNRSPHSHRATALCVRRSRRASLVRLHPRSKAQRPQAKWHSQNLQVDDTVVGPPFPGVPNGGGFVAWSMTEMPTHPIGMSGLRLATTSADPGHGRRGIFVEGEHENGMGVGR
jgi:hypothetical protein